MTSWKPYLWKECRQNLRLGLASLGVFLGIGLLPGVIDHLRGASRRYDDDALLVIIQLGGPILAVLVGVYAMGREQGTIQRFWQSRPIDLKRWLLSKYVVGLAIVWLACWIPLLTWMVLIKTVSTADVSLYSPARLLLVHSFILLLIYSASFVLGQYIRGTLHAAILSVGAMAMVLIMPLVIRPLNWLSVELLRRADIGTLAVPSYIAFAAAMTALSIALLGLAGILSKRNTQIDMDQRTLTGSVVAILLVLAASIAFPMGTNLPAQQVIPLPVLQDAMVYDMAVDGNDLLVLLSDGPEHASGRGRRYGLLRVHIGEQTSEVGDPLWFIHPQQEPNLPCTAIDLAWSADTPSLAYVTVRRDRRTDEERALALYTIALDAKQSDPVLHRVELSPLIDAPVSTTSLCQGRLYVYDDSFHARLLTFSVTDPRAPSLVQKEDLDQDLGFAGPRQPGSPLQEYQVHVVPNASLNGSVRLEVTHKLAPYDWALTGDERVLASVPDPSGGAMQLVLFETGPADSNVVPLRPVARRRAGAIERFLPISYGGQLFSSNHLAYRLSGLGVTVYDTSDPKQIKRIGHYAAGEGFSTMATLPNHRVVIAGERLHILDLSNRMPR